MKKYVWKRPPSYKGYRSNKKVLSTFAVMAQGLAVTANDRSFSDRLTDIRRKLEYRIGDNGRADVRFYVNTVFDDFIALRDAMNDADSIETESYLQLLESDVKKLSDLIRERVAITPWDDSVDHRVARFIQNVASIRDIYKRTSDDLKRMQKQHNKVATKLTTPQCEVDRKRLELRERRINAYCTSRERAVTVLEDIIDELSELTAMAHTSPALAGRINRYIKIKSLADFYMHPQRSQKQREKLKGELLYIIKSLENQMNLTDTWGAVMYGIESEAAKKLNCKEMTKQCIEETAQTSFAGDSVKEDANKQNLIKKESKKYER